LRWRPHIEAFARLANELSVNDITSRVRDFVWSAAWYAAVHQGIVVADRRAGMGCCVARCESPKRHLRRCADRLAPIRGRSQPDDEQRQRRRCHFSGGPEGSHVEFTASRGQPQFSSPILGVTSP
jgi:hypothetical protein